MDHHQLPQLSCHLSNQETVRYLICGNTLLLIYNLLVISTEVCDTGSSTVTTAQLRIWLQLRPKTVQEVTICLRQLGLESDAHLHSPQCTASGTAYDAYLMRQVGFFVNVLANLPFIQACVQNIGSCKLPEV